MLINSMLPHWLENSRLLLNSGFYSLPDHHAGAILSRLFFHTLCHALQSTLQVFGKYLMFVHSSQTRGSTPLLQPSGENVTWDYACHSLPPHCLPSLSWAARSWTLTQTDSGRTLLSQEGSGRYKPLKPENKKVLQEN